MAGLDETAQKSKQNTHFFVRKTHLGFWLYCLSHKDVTEDETWFISQQPIKLHQQASICCLICP